MLTRRHLVACILAVAATPMARARAATPVFYRNPGCGCCHAWTERMADAGLPVAMEDKDDLVGFSASLGIPAGLGEKVSGFPCHLIVG